MSYWARRQKVKRKISLAIVIAVILISAALIGYYLESGPGSNSTWGNPSLVYDFNSTILFNGVDGYYYGGSFLGWNTTGNVFNNETYAVSIHLGGSLSRRFEAVNSTFRVSFDWLFEATMVVSRQLKGVYSDLTYSYSSEGVQPNTNATNFDIDNGTTFVVRFEPSGGLSTYLYRVELWNSIESS
jgi:hypothetical protein